MRAGSGGGGDPHQPPVGALADALEAANLLRHFTDSREVYGDVPDDVRALALHTTLVERLELALALTQLPDLNVVYVRPHFENTSNTVQLTMVATVMAMWLAEPLGVSPDDVRGAFERYSEHVSPDLMALRERVQEILVFECREPLARAGRQFASPERALFMLGEYWALYRDMLLQHGKSVVSWSPHPLLRFIVSCRARIEQCLRTIGSPELSAAFAEVLEIPFDRDSADLWDEWGAPRLEGASLAYEEARSRGPVVGFDMTQAESLFISVCRGELRLLDAKARETAAKYLRPARTKAGSFNATGVPGTCFDWIAKVERALRKLVVAVAKSSSGEEWQGKVRKWLGAAAVEAENVMKQRGVEDAAQLIHFTQLKDLVEIVRANYADFEPLLGLRRREFNRLTALIVKGRTETAHNRPEHLWPAKERKRTEVACADLLDAMKQGE